MRVLVAISFVLSLLFADDIELQAQKLYELKQYKEAYELLSSKDKKTDSDTKSIWIAKR